MKTEKQFVTNPASFFPSLTMPKTHAPIPFLKEGNALNQRTHNGQGTAAL